MPRRVPVGRGPSDSEESVGTACPPFERLDVDWTMRTLYRPRTSSPPCRGGSAANRAERGKGDAGPVADQTLHRGHPATTTPLVGGWLGPRLLPRTRVGGLEANGHEAGG